MKSPTYRDPGSIKLNTVIFKIVKDPSAQVNALLAGDVDAFPGFQAPELVERLKKDPRFVVVVGTTEGEVILATNNAKKPFSDLKVRQAIAHAINRDELISAESGFGVPIGSHFAPHNKAYLDLTKTYPFDIAKAKALLAEAGYPNGFEASLKLPPVGYAQRAGEVIASQLGKIGIKVAITQLQWPQWLSEVFKERNYDLTIVAHTEANDLDRYARDGYYWGYNSPEFKAKWREVVAATDFAKRDELLKDAQRIVARDAVNGFLFQLAKIGVWKKDLVGMWENSPTPQVDLTGVYWKSAASLALAGVMLEFLSRRLAAALVTLALATVVVFAVVEVLPGDPALVMLGTDARPDTLAALRANTASTSRWRCAICAGSAAC